MRKGDGAADDKGVTLKALHYQRPASVLVTANGSRAAELPGQSKHQTQVSHRHHHHAHGLAVGA